MTTATVKELERVSAAPLSPLSWVYLFILSKPIPEVSLHGFVPAVVPSDAKEFAFEISFKERDFTHAFNLFTY